MKKRDCILILCLLVFFLVLTLATRPHDEGGSAYIYTGSSLYGVYDLTDDALITIENEDNTVNEIEISDGSVFMRSAGCPDKLCVRSGRISRNKEVICCAPEGIIITVMSDVSGEYDAVTK